MNSPKTYRKLRPPKEWTFLGDFTNDHEVDEIRRRQKVSKRKTDHMKDGIKHFYKCNKWNRIRCQYQMYVKIFPDSNGAPSTWSLYETGEHTHDMTPGRTTKTVLMAERENAIRMGAIPGPSFEGRLQTDEELLNTEIESPQPEEKLTLVMAEVKSEQLETRESTIKMEVESEPVSEQDNYLQNFKQQTTTASETPSATCKHSDQSSDFQFREKTQEFSLNDGASIAGLLQIATDSDLTFTFNARRSGEYCFESNKPERKCRMVVFSDHNTVIRVGQIVNGKEINVEKWRKSDWTQFCCAVRGTCLHFFRS